MPPKGVLKTPSELGSVQQIKDGWRFVLPAMHDLREHTNTSGPVRQTKAKADKDKANARMCKSRKQMLEFVRGLRTGTCGGGVHPATDDILAVEAIAPAGSSADLAWSEDDTAAVEEHAEGGHVDGSLIVPGEKATGAGKSKRSKSKHPPNSAVEVEASGSDGKRSAKRRRSAAAGASQPAGDTPSGQPAAVAKRPQARNALTYRSALLAEVLQNVERRQLQVPPPQLDRQIKGSSSKTAASSEAMQTGASEPCEAFPSQRPVEDEQLQHEQQSTDAGPTFTITLMHAMSGDTFPLEIPFTDSLCRLKHRIALRLGARSSDLTIMFRSHLVGEDGSKGWVINKSTAWRQMTMAAKDLGLGDGSVIKFVRHPVYKEVVVHVHVVDLEEADWWHQRGEINFRFNVEWNMPCATTIKAEVMRLCDKDQKTWKEITNPHLFLMNYADYDEDAVFPFTDKHCLDAVPFEFDTKRIYVIDQDECQCGTCDLSWMLDNWICPQLWHAAGATEAAGRQSAGLEMA